VKADGRGKRADTRYSILDSRYSLKEEDRGLDARNEPENAEKWKILNNDKTHNRQKQP
jgi:hypothetical protein